MTKVNEQMQTGIVVNFNKSKGYAFIKPEGSTSREDNVFLHISDMVRKVDFINLKLGESVIYTEVGTDKGKSAVNVVVENV